MARKTWTIADTCTVAEAVIAADGNWQILRGQYDTLAEQVGSTRDSIDLVVWRMITVLGYPTTSQAQGITALDRAVAHLYLNHDPRLKGRN